MPTGRTWPRQPGAGSTRRCRRARGGPWPTWSCTPGWCTGTSWRSSGDAWPSRRARGRRTRPLGPSCSAGTTRGSRSCSPCSRTPTPRPGCGPSTGPTRRSASGTGAWPRRRPCTGSTPRAPRRPPAGAGALAADGVTELLEVFLAPTRTARRWAARAKSLHLHATDTGRVAAAAAAGRGRGRPGPRPGPRGRRPAVPRPAAVPLGPGLADPLEVSGDPALLSRVRELAAAATQ